MKETDLFYYKDYEEAYNFAEENNLIILEAPADEKGKRYKFEKRNTYDSTIDTNINELKDWYNTYYTQHEQKYRRLHSLGKLTDEGTNPYDELIKLYNEAEIKRARIQELERLLSDSTK